MSRKSSVDDHINAIDEQDDLEFSYLQMEQDADSSVSIPKAVVLLINTITGLSMLSVSFCFRNGIALNLILSLGLASLALLSFILLIDSSSTSDLHEYGDLMVKAFGAKYRWVPNIFIIIVLIGVSILYTQYAYELMTSGLEDFGVKSGWYTGRPFLMIVCLVCISFPLIMLPSINALSYASMFSVVLTFIYMVHTVYFFFKDGLADGFDPKGQIKWFNFGSTFVASISIQATAYTCHPNVFPTLKKLENPSAARKTKTMTYVVFIAFLMYAFVGIFGYLTLFEDITGAVVIAYYKKGRIFTQITKMLYSVLLLVTIPNLLWAARLCIHGMFFEGEINRKRSFGIGAVIVAVVATLSIFVKKIVTTFSFVGGLCSPSLVYILPPLFYLRICEGQSGVKTILSKGLIVIGIFVIVICVRDAIISL